MKDADKTGNKVSAFIKVVKHSHEYTAYSLKKTVKKLPVFEKERPQVLINGENKMPVSTVDEFEGHLC